MTTEIEKKKINFSDSCKYKAIRFKDNQHEAMNSFSKDHNVDIFYLFYNPIEIPWSIDSPVEQIPELGTNLVGCRVVPKDILDDGLVDKDDNFSPSYSDVSSITNGKLQSPDSIAGWRLEYFVNELFIACKKGTIDDSPNFELLLSLMSQKSSPISSAISITFDLDA